MKKYFILALLFLPCVASMAACGNTCRKKVAPVKMFPDSTVYSMLGRTVSDILYHPDKVKCYSLKGKEKVDSSDFQVEPHWVRDSLLGELSAELYGTLQFVLFDDKENYQNDSLLVKAPYIPVVEFEFSKKKTVVHVLVSPSDHTWTIVFDDRRHLHFNYKNIDVMQRFCDFLYKQNQ